MSETMPKYKYRIAEVVNNMPKVKHDTFFANFKEAVGVDVRTYYRWISIPYDADFFIGQRDLAALAEYIGVKPEDLLNYKIIPKKTDA